MSDIEIVLELYDADVPRGSGWKKMKCPFHEDRTASAQVNHDVDRFNCFTCDIAAGPVKLIMMQEGLSGREATDRLRELGGGDEPLRTVRGRGKGLPTRPRHYGGDGPEVQTRLRYNPDGGS